MIIQSTGSYFVNIQDGSFTFANPNLAAILAFLKTNEELVIAPLFIVAAWTLALVAVWRTTRKPVPVPPVSRIPRKYLVKRSGEIVFTVEAYDVDLEDEPTPYLNFLGEEVSNGVQASVAILEWNDEYTVSSEPLPTPEAAHA